MKDNEGQLKTRKTILDNKGQWKTKKDNERQWKTMKNRDRDIDY